MVNLIVKLHFVYYITKIKSRVQSLVPFGTHRKISGDCVRIGKLARSVDDVKFLINMLHSNGRWNFDPKGVAEKGI